MRNFTTLFRRDKKAWFEEECLKINEHNENRKSRELFQQIAKVKKRNYRESNQSVINKDGQREPEEVLNRWNEYGTDLFSTVSGQKTGTESSLNFDQMER